MNPSRRLTNVRDGALRLGGVPLLGIIEILAIIGGGGLAAIFGFLKLKSNADAKRAAYARDREEAAVGELARDRASNTAGDIIKRKAHAENLARVAENARLEAVLAAAEAGHNSERARTAAAVAKGAEAMAARANEAIDEGKLPRGKVQP